MPFVTAAVSSFLGAMLFGRDRVIRRLEYELFGYWPEHEYFTWRRQLPVGLFPRLLLLLSPPAGFVALLGRLLGPGPFALPPPPSSFPRPVGFSRMAFSEQPVLVLLVPLAFVFSLLGVPLRLVSDICLPRLADVFGDLCLPPPPASRLVRRRLPAPQPAPGSLAAVLAVWGQRWLLPLLSRCPARLLVVVPAPPVPLRLRFRVGSVLPHHLFGRPPLPPLFSRDSFGLPHYRHSVGEFDY